MQRLLLALIAVGMLVTGLLLTFSGLPEFWSQSLAYIAIRVGILLGVLWLALPQFFELLSRCSPQTVICIASGILILVIRPRYVAYVAPLLLIALGLQFLGRFLGGPRPPGTRSGRGARGRSARKDND